MGSMKPVQVIAVTGGKGGVGKTNVAVNLGVALAEMQRRVILMDADLGLANVDVLLGLRAKRNMYDVLQGDAELHDIIVDGPSGLKIVPASSGVQRMAELSAQEHAGLIHAFSQLGDQVDTLLIDTAAGISETVVSFVRAAQEILMVVTDEPSSITDAYALIKLLNTQHEISRFHVLANMTRSQHEGKNLFGKLSQVTDRFLDVTLEYMGHIPNDEQVRRAVQRQKSVMEFAPSSKAAQAFRTLAQKIDGWPLPSSPRGHLEFFVERLIRSTAMEY